MRYLSHLDSIVDDVLDASKQIGAHELELLASDLSLEVDVVHEAFDLRHRVRVRREDVLDAIGLFEDLDYRFRVREHVFLGLLLE